MDILLNLIILFSVAQSKILEELNVQNSNAATESTSYTINERNRTKIATYEGIDDIVTPKSLNSSNYINFESATLASVHNMNNLNKEHQVGTNFTNELNPEGENFFAETGNVLISDEENVVGPRFLSVSRNSTVSKNDSLIVIEIISDPELESYPDNNKNSHNASVIQDANVHIIENLNGNNSSSDISDANGLRTEESITNELTSRKVFTKTPVNFESDDEVYIEVISADKVSKRINSSSVQLMMDTDQFDHYNESNIESVTSKNDFSTTPTQENNIRIDILAHNVTPPAMAEVTTVPETTIMTEEIKEFLSTESTETPSFSKNSSFRMLTNPNITESDTINELYNGTTPKRFSEDLLHNRTTLNIGTKLPSHLNNESSTEEKNHSNDLTTQETITIPHADNFIHPLNARNFSYNTAESNFTTTFSTSLKNKVSIEVNHFSSITTETSNLTLRKDYVHISTYPNATKTEINQTVKTSPDTVGPFNTVIMSTSSDILNISPELPLLVTTTAIEDLDTTVSTKGEVLSTTVQELPVTTVHPRPTEAAEKNENSTETVRVSSAISEQLQNATVSGHVISNTTKKGKSFTYPLNIEEVENVTSENQTLLYTKSTKSVTNSTVVYHNETTLKPDKHLSTLTLLLSTKNILIETKSSKPISTDATTSFSHQSETTRIFTSQQTLLNKSTTQKIEDSSVSQNVSIKPQKPTYIATYVENLNKQDKMDAITASFNLSMEKYNKESSINLFLMWLMQAIVQDAKNRSMDWSFEDLGIQVVFIKPTPQICDNQIIFSFVIKSSITNETLSANLLMPLLISDKEWISNKLNASSSHFSYGLYLDGAELKNAGILENVQAMIIICGIVFLIILLCVAIGIALRCKKKRSILYLSDTTMFRKDMNLPTDMGSVNAAMEFDNSVSSKDCPETLPRYSTYNGFQLPSVDDNEGWIVPIGQKPEKDLNAPPIQDTPM